MELIENDPDSVVIRLRRQEVITLNNALNEILSGPDAIENPEFQTRVGVSREDARSLLSDLHQLLG
jgi:hypothetical protein